MLQTTQPPSPPLLFLFWVTYHLLIYKTFYLSYIWLWPFSPCWNLSSRRTETISCYVYCCSPELQLFLHLVLRTPLSVLLYQRCSFLSALLVSCSILGPWGAAGLSSPGFALYHLLSLPLFSLIISLVFTNLIALGKVIQRWFRKRKWKRTV